MLTARLLMVPVMVLTARPYGIWRDWLVGRLRPSGRLATATTDTAAFLSFQVPVYVGSLVLAGAAAAEIVAAAVSATLFMLVIGRPFGLYLDAVRRWAGVVPVTTRPPGAGL